MIDLKNLEVWFITGSQHLYGEETLSEVDRHSMKIVEYFNYSEMIPVKVIFKPVVKTSEEIYRVITGANNSEKCIGLITWMHTFSPAKMWIRGLKILNKPLLHLHTQFNRDIPWGEIDMDFMNTNQSAHGDREFGFITARMNIRRKIVVGHWKDQETLQEINTWARAASAWNDWQGARFVRFGDNMRFVAVTEGDKVEAENQFGFSVNTHGIGDLAEIINNVNKSDVTALVKEYENKYKVDRSLQKDGKNRNSLIQAARIELGIEKFLIEGNYKGFTDTFEDLHGIVQLPGIAVQRLLNKGYGFGAEGDWKTAALVRAMKVMGSGLPGGNAFMEDYTYHLDPDNPMVLGSHMLEVDESIAKGEISCEIHPLGIGGKADPVRLVFNAGGGAALNASLVDFGKHFRLIVNEVTAVEPENDLPNLPVARVLWKPLPDFKTALKSWILAGGAHHTCFSQNLTRHHLDDFSTIAGIEMVLIGSKTNYDCLKHDLLSE